jgi:oxygen-independent coproporphyrinogen-3 oxidase
MPSADTKLQILALAIRKLTEAGYVYIGMDHFAKPDDELAVAQRQGRLHRNFQGYSTYADCDMLAFGISAIGKVGRPTSRTSRPSTSTTTASTTDPAGVPRHRAERRRHPAARDHPGADVPLRAVDRVDRDRAPDRFPQVFRRRARRSQGAGEGGLLKIDEKWISVLPPGRMLVRAIAMVFDRYLRADRQRTRYSKVI